MSNRIKILIIGDGFIGNGLNDFYKGKYDVRLTSKAELDVCSLPSVESFFRENNDFTHVIYAAGIKNIGFCESNLASTVLNAAGSNGLYQQPVNKNLWSVILTPQTVQHT